MEDARFPMKVDESVSARLFREGEKCAVAMRNGHEKRVVSLGVAVSRPYTFRLVVVNYDVAGRALRKRLQLRR